MTIKPPITCRIPFCYRLKPFVVFALLAFLPDVLLAQSTANHPFDGMSTIDISVAAAKRKYTKTASNHQGAIGAQAEVVSTVDFYSFNIVELKGRFLHEGWYPIPGDPLPGTVTVQAELIGSWQTAHFMLLDEADQLIENITLSVPAESAGSSTFLGTIEVPSQAFKVAVSGEDSDGVSFTITRPDIFRPQTVEVRFDSLFALVDAGVAQFSLSITNHGPLDTFQISVEDDMGVGVTSEVTAVELNMGETATTAINLQVPAVSSGLLDITITATAMGTSNPSSTNYGTTLARVQRFNLILNSGFEEGQPVNDGGTPQ